MAMIVYLIFPNNSIGAELPSIGKRKPFMGKSKKETLFLLT